jgi:hypothetical protein
VRQFSLEEGSKLQWEFRSNGKEIEIVVTPANK